MGNGKTVLYNMAYNFRQIRSPFLALFFFMIRAYCELQHWSFNFAYISSQFVIVNSALQHCSSKYSTSYFKWFNMQLLNLSVVDIHPQSSREPSTWAQQSNKLSPQYRRGDPNISTQTQTARKKIGVARKILEKQRRFACRDPSFSSVQRNNKRSFYFS